MVVPKEQVMAVYEEKVAEKKAQNDFLTTFEEPFIRQVVDTLEDNLNQKLLKTGFQARCDLTMYHSIKEIMKKVLSGLEPYQCEQFELRLQRLLDEAAKRIIRDYEEAEYNVWARKTAHTVGIEAAVWTDDKLANENYIGINLHRN